VKFIKQCYKNMREVQQKQDWPVITSEQAKFFSDTQVLTM